MFGHQKNRDSSKTYNYSEIWTFRFCMKAPVVNIIASVTGKELKLNYLCKTSQVNYSISDLSGTIIQHGNYDCLVDSTVPIPDLPAGLYELFIIDGDEFCKAQFRKT